MPRLKAMQRRQQLMEVATKLFAQNGYDATTTFAIAEAAGVTEPILYRHFTGKQSLFVAIVQAMSVATLKHWKMLIAGVADPLERLRRIAGEFPTYIEKLGDAARVIHGALATTRDEQVKDVIRRHYQQIEEFFVNIVKEGQSTGTLRPNVDPRVPAWHLINSGIGYAMISLNLQQFDYSLVQQAIEFMLEGMRKG